MVSNWFITGDCHRDFSRFNLTKDGTNFKTDDTAAVIILGDAGINYKLDHHDDELKNSIIKKYKCYFYCVRGNHEARPQDVMDMKLIYDQNVGGDVYVQEEWPTIRYFKDWGIYTIGTYKIAVIGGAYSVDKWHRLVSAGMDIREEPTYPSAIKAGWFPNEQLSTKEMRQAKIELQNQHYNFIFTHTCPLSVEPSDLFLGGIDQSTVDKSTEVFLEELTNYLTYDVWCFGHYHQDRLERPYIEMYYHDIDKLDNIWQRWQNYKKYNELDWWLVKSPNFFMH